MIHDLYGEILSAKHRLEPYVRKTPLIHSHGLSALCGNQVHLKLENMQMTGAFKLRGALNKLFTLTPSELRSGVICASAGNHAQGVAYGAALLRLKATIVMPRHTPTVKVEATKRMGAHVLLEGHTFEEAANFAQKLAKSEGLAMIHPYDDLFVMAGQGTLGLEILEQLPTCQTLLVPVGGGGLLAGIIAAIKMCHPHIEVIGVEPIGAASMFLSYHGKQLQSLAKVNTKAEGVAVRTPGTKPFEIVRNYCDDICVVSEEAIEKAVYTLMRDDKVVTEYAGALSIAALATIRPKNRAICCLVSGGNIDPLRLQSVLSAAQFQSTLNEEVYHDATRS